MIRIYPSALDGEPLETHSIKREMTLADFMRSKVPNFDEHQGAHPVSISVNDYIVKPEKWDQFHILPDDDVKITPEPKGGIAIAVLVVVSVVALAAAYFMMRNMKTPKDRQKGTSLDGSGVNANTVRWGDPIPEIAGNPLSYPVMLSPVHKWYETDNNWHATEYAEFLLCVGKGEYQLSLDNVFIGETPVTQLTDSVTVKIFQPDADLSGEGASQWWHQSQEAGFTTFGGSGLTLGVTSNKTVAWQADRLTRVNAYTIEGVQDVPSDWVSGLFVAPSFTHIVTFGADWVQSSVLDNAEVAAFDEVEIEGERYTVYSITPATGVDSGALASIEASASPARYDFDVTPVTFRVELAGIQYSITLNEGATDITGLVDMLNAKLNGTPLIATQNASKITISQQGLPNGASISLDGSYSAVLGSSPIITQGRTPTTAQAKKYHLTGASFVAGAIRAQVDVVGAKYEITSTPNANQITLNLDGVIGWAGFPSDAQFSSIKLHPDSYSLGWSGAFRVTPKNVEIDKIEVDIFYPQGLIAYNKKSGDAKSQFASGRIEYRKIGAPDWTSVTFSKTARTPNQIGFTHVFDVEQGEYEVRVAANEAPSDSSQVYNTQQWTGLKGRIVHDKTRYEGMTTLTVRMKSGDAISGGVENKIKVRAKRILKTLADPNVVEPTSDIAPFLLHIFESVGYGRELFDMETLTELDEVWRARGERFDAQFTGESTLKVVANHVLRAGFSELTLRDGLIRPVRDGMRSGMPSRIFSPQEYTQPLTQITQLLQVNDIDGVDVEYTDHKTGATVTEEYRLAGDEGRRVEKITLIGVTGRTQAWRQAARRRRELAYRRTQFQGATELHALNCQYGDFVGLQDGIPKFGQSAFVLGVNGNSVLLSEPIQAVSGQLMAAVRRADGTVTQAQPITHDGSWITFSTLPIEIKTQQGATDAAVVYLGEYYGFYEPAIMVSVEPDEDGIVKFQAVGYDSRVYEDDNSTPYDSHLTSLNYPHDDFIDNISAGFKLSSIGIRYAQKVRQITDSAEFGFKLKSIATRFPVINYSVEPDSAEFGFTLVGISKTRPDPIPPLPIITQTIEPESLDAGFKLVSIATKFPVITQTIEPESLEAGFKLTNILKVKE